MTRRWWISTPRWTCGVDTDGSRLMLVGSECVSEKIVWAAPIVRRFVGQPLSALLDWALKTTGDVRRVELPVDAPTS